MHRKFEMNWTKIKAGCQSGRKVVTHNSKSDLPLAKISLFCRGMYLGSIHVTWDNQLGNIENGGCVT